MSAPSGDRIIRPGSAANKGPADEAAPADEVDTDDEIAADVDATEFDETDLDDTDLDEEDLDDTEYGDVDAAAKNLLGRGRPPRTPRPPRDGGEPKPHGPLARLYRGETRFDFVGRRRTWFTLSSLIIVAGIISIILRGGLNLGH